MNRDFKEMAEAVQIATKAMKEVACERDDLIKENEALHDLHDEVLKLRADLAAARAESDLAHWLLRNARKYMNPMHEALCAAIDNVLQKKQAALAVDAE